MGCDIHLFIEYRDKRDEEWDCFAANLNPGRNYDIFNRLAGVRGSPENAIVPPRGYPVDASCETEDYNYKYVGEGDDTVISKSIAEMWIKAGSHYKGEEPYLKISNPDWHTHTWLTLKEFKRVLNEMEFVNATYWGIVGAMKELEKRGCETRVVIFFDN